MSADFSTYNTDPEQLERRQIQMCPEMSKREQRCLGGHLISLDKIGLVEWLGDKGKGGRKTAGRRDVCQEVENCSC